MWIQLLHPRCFSWVGVLLFSSWIFWNTSTIMSMFTLTLKLPTCSCHTPTPTRSVMRLYLQVNTSTWINTRFIHDTINIVTVLLLAWACVCKSVQRSIKTTNVKTRHDSYLMFVLSSRVTMQRHNRRCKTIYVMIYSNKLTYHNSTSLTN